MGVLESATPSYESCSGLTISAVPRATGPGTVDLEVLVLGSFEQWFHTDLHLDKVYDLLGPVTYATEPGRVDLVMCGTTLNGCLKW